MTKDEFELLNAYIDGELDPEMAAELTRRIASDDTLARRVAKLFEMKHAVASLRSEVVRASATGRRPHPWSAAALAACIAVLVSLAGFFAARLLPANNTDAQHTIVADALLKHDSWVNGTRGDIIRPVSAAFFAPRLNEAGLFLASAQDDVLIGRHHATWAGFVGEHGCHLSLFAWRSDDGPAPLELRITGHTDTASWSARKEQFLMVARDMNKARFAMISRAVSALTAEMKETDPQTALMLQNARQPCIASG